MRWPRVVPLRLAPDRDGQVAVPLLEVQVVHREAIRPGFLRGGGVHGGLRIGQLVVWDPIRGRRHDVASGR